MERSREYLLNLISKGDKSVLVDIVDTMFSKREDVKKVKVTEKTTVSSVASITGSVFWDSILSKPSEFPPIAHNHQISEVVGLSEILGSYTHNGFSDLQGGISGEYFHLSYSQYATVSSLTGWATKAYTNGSTTDVAEGTNLYFTDARADARITLQKGVANGIASLGSDGKVPLSQLPATTIVDTFVVASQTAMLALVAQQGDVCVRTDLSKTFILKADPASTLTNWQEILSPTDGVQSVAMTVSGPLSVSGSPITSTGTLGLTWSGSSSNLVRADGSVVASSSFSSVSHTHSSLSMYGAAPTSATAPSGFAPTSGLSIHTAYGQDYPTSYGNLINVRGTGGNQIYLGWSATNGGTDGMWFRNKRDAYDGWSPWQYVYTSTDFTVTSFAKTILDDADAASVRATIGAQVAGSYQPLENQRLSTTNSVTFAYVTSTGGATLGGWLVTPYGTLREYTGSASYQGFYPSGVTPNNNNFAVLWHSSNAQTYLNATSGIYLQIFDGTTRNDRLIVKNTSIDIYANTNIYARSLVVGATGNAAAIEFKRGSDGYSASFIGHGAATGSDSEFRYQVGGGSAYHSWYTNNGTNTAERLQLTAAGNLIVRNFASGSILPVVANESGVLNNYSTASFRTLIGAQAALTNPVTGTGVNTCVAWWNGTTTLAAGNFTFDGTRSVTIGGTGNSGLLQFKRNDGAVAASVGYAASATEAQELRFSSFGGGAWMSWYTNVGEKMRLVEDGTLTLQGNHRIRMPNSTSSLVTALAIGESRSSNVSTGNGVSFDFKLDVAETVKGRISALINTSVSRESDLVFSTYGVSELQESFRLRGSDKSAWFYGVVAPVYSVSYDLGSLGNRWNKLFVAEINHPAIEVSGSGGANLPTGAATGTHLYYAGRIAVATDSVTIPSGETVWYRSSDGSTSALVGPTTLNVNRRFVHLVKYVNEWRIVGLYN